MAETIAEAGTMDANTTRDFVEKIDMACTALREPQRIFDGYGCGVTAAYQLLSEAQALAPDNQAVASELEKLRDLMNVHYDDNANSAVATAVNEPPAPENSNRQHTLNAAEQVMQHWKVQPVIEILVCVSQQQLKGLADTIDSIAAQTYTNWKLTVISDIAAPDPVFLQHDILQWIQTDDFQFGLNDAVSRSTADWLGLVSAGSSFTGDALFSLANQDNLKGDQWQIIYSDEDHVDENKNCIQPLRKPDFDIQQFNLDGLIGEFCFIRKTVFEKIGCYDLSETDINHGYVSRAVTSLNVESIGHISNILLHRPLAKTENNETPLILNSNVA